MPAEQDEAHYAMERFDVWAFVYYTQSEFRGARLWSDEYADGPSMFLISDLTGNHTNWVDVDMPFGQVTRYYPR